MRGVFFLLGLMATIVVDALVTEAQQEDPRSFFPKDFVQGASAKHTTPSQAEPPPLDSEQVDLSAVMNLAENKAGLFAQVIVNSVDKEHFDVVCQKVLSLHRGGRMRIVSLGHMGSHQNISEKQREQLSQAGIRIVPFREIPKQIPVSVSPAWMVTTGKENYIIEGFYEPERFFTTDGVFVPPVGMEVEYGSTDGFNGELKEF